MADAETGEARARAARAPGSSARDEAVRALEGEFGELVNRFRRLITEQAHRVSPGMLPGAYKVFTTIERRGSVSLSALADDLQMDKGQLSRTVRELEQLGLIHRVPDPHDGRVSILSATEEGLERLAAARGRREDGNPLIDALQSWKVEDIQTFTTLMHALVAAEPPAL